MQASAGSQQHAQQINVRIPRDYGFFDQETGNIQERPITFGVEFNELFHLFNRQKLDINLLRLWAAYQIREMRQMEVKKVAILDPVVFNYGVIGLEPEKDHSRTLAYKYLVACLAKYPDHDFILFLLNLEDHWVTLLICLPSLRCTTSIHYFRRRVFEVGTGNPSNHSLTLPGKWRPREN
ncbi:hypothetical protein BRADI_3g18652v3 [Brachypodium distachyon]|uniref:Ubiquitin-like protease family profile domain-containing protein n=1 Tax=Brachypodium distachyon TaxID=15368 RepID=A0A0Q3Q251_BRADI|nr:hypothetical protein BRADI_3g18652v3 [Brachypodium distachyon]